MNSAEKTTTRIEIIDILRGITLLGIILVHFTEQYYAGQPPEVHKDFGAHNLADNIVLGVVGIFISGKFFMIFSFLFGLSFFIQLDKSDGSARFVARFAWRLIVLFLIGLIHHLHYRGDILTIYAVLGVGLLLCYKLPDRWLFWVAIVLVLNAPTIISRTMDVITPPVKPPFFMNQDQKILEAYYNTVKSGAYLEILKANFYEFKSKFEFQVGSGRIYITMGLFLLGFYAGRKKVFEQVDFFRKLIRIGLWALLGCVIFAALTAGIVFILKAELTQPQQFLLGGTIFDIFNAALASIYVGLIVTAFQKEKWKHRLMPFYAVGRMGLTTYLMQAAIGTLLLFSYGLGLLGEYGAAVWALAALLIFYLQITFSEWWLSRFQFGLIEWLWRSLTYFKIQPFRKSK